ncbi:MAG TPA: protein kinase [Lentisphaeria bacterium]|nr:protein kinase [Lentisphaeria bacterium]
MTDNKGRAEEQEPAGNEELILPSPENRTYISLSAETEPPKASETEPPTAEVQKAVDTPIIPESGKRVYINLNKTDSQERADKTEDDASTAASSGNRDSAVAQAESQDGSARKASPGIADTQELPPAALRKVTQPPPHNAIRDQVARGKYRLEHMIARGAESVLYRANCNGHQVCVKAVRNSINKWLGDSITRNQEERLEKVSYRTKLRHIRNEFDVSKLLYSEDDTPTVHIYALRRISRLGLELGYDLIMEYLTGHDLGDKILSRALTLTDKVNVFYRAIQAVAFMHQKKLIHLDIKPSNFMLVRDRVKLIDFGVSVRSGHRPRAITGTSGYLSPEQICKDTLDEGTDIFALGVAFAVFFGGKSLNQPQEMLLQRQTRLDMQYHLSHDAQPVVNEAPDLNSVPPIFEVLRACTIPRRDLRINKCDVLLNLLRQKAEQAGIKLMG